MQAEQGLLGILLFDNESIHRIPTELRMHHFYEPIHGRVFHEIQSGVAGGHSVDSLILAGRFDEASLSGLGGTSYLMQLMDQAPPVRMAAEYANEIMAVSLRREIIRACDEIREIAFDDTTTSAEALQEAEKSIGALRVKGGPDRFTTATEAVDRVFASMDAPESEIHGVLTGIEPIDRHLGALMAEDLIVLGGRPSMGKSALASVIGQNVALGGAGVLEINSEMSVEQMMRRHLTSVAYSIYASQSPSYSAIRKRTVGYDQRVMLERAGEIIRALPLLSVKRTGLTISRLRTMVQRQIVDWTREGVRPGVVIIDHVGHMKGDSKSRGRYEDQTEISNGLKELAGDLKIPIIALAQLSRQIEARDDKRPTMADLRDSGAWEQDADIVIGCYREAYYAQREAEPKDTGSAASSLAWSEWDRRRKSSEIEAILLKVREGETGSIKLWGHMSTNTILGRAPDFDGGLL